MDDPNMHAYGEEGPTDAEIGRHWRENSSLEKWFPITAERLAALEAKNAALAREAHSWWAALAGATAEVENWRRRAERCVTAWTVVRGGVWDPNGLMDEHMEALRKALRPSTPVGWSDTDWLAHLEQLRQKAEVAYARGPLPERGWD